FVPIEQLSRSGCGILALGSQAVERLRAGVLARFLEVGEQRVAWITARGYPQAPQQVGLFFAREARQPAAHLVGPTRALGSDAFGPHEAGGGGAGPLQLG